MTQFIYMAGIAASLWVLWHGSRFFGRVFRDTVNTLINLTRGGHLNRWWVWITCPIIAPFDSIIEQTKALWYGYEAWVPRLSRERIQWHLKQTANPEEEARA